MTRARVLLLTAALGPLDYRVPRESEAPLGSVVIAPLGPRRLGGVVWEDASFGAPEAVGDNRLRNLYGANYGLDIVCPPEGGTRVTLHLPMVLVQTETEQGGHIS